MAITMYLSIITLNVNGLTAPIKRHMEAEWIKKQDPYLCYLWETHFRSNETHRLKEKEWKLIFQANRNKKSWGSNTYIWQIDFNTKAVIGDKGGHIIVIKKSIQQEDINLANIYVPQIKDLNV